MIGNCPAENPDKNLESLCNGKSSLLDLPVSDLDTNVIYKNAFCARCNNVAKEAYWKFFATCHKNYTLSDNILNNRSLMLEFIMTNCKWSFLPRENNDLKRCLAVEKECPDSEYVQTEPLLPNLCSFYAFPVCYNVRKKNPHCEICRGMDISSYHCDCSHLGPTLEPPLGISGSLLILFDFSSSSSHTMTVGKHKTVVTNKACADGFAFDPFRDRCIQLHMTKSANSTNETAGKVSCNGSGFAHFDITLVTLYSNGSLWIPLYKRMYSNHSYFIKNSSVFVCLNLTRNYTEMTALASEDSVKVTVQQIVTYIGCAVSMMSLILLVCIYAFIAELRTLPGKNLMSLSIAMLLFHIFFLLNGQTNRPNLCNAAAFLLHYFLLSSFCWMSVMAFDVVKTFASKGT